MGRNCFPAEDAGGTPARAYNVILISICSLRADHLGCYGYRRHTSPRMDRLAREGVLFENAFSHASFTMASLMSIYTSLYPQSHGVIYPFKDKLSAQVRTLPEMLKAAGYTTAYFADMSEYTNPDIGFGRGFDCVEKINRGYERPEDNRGELRKIFGWLEGTKGAPFFFHYHAMNIHEPYFASFKYERRFAKNYRGAVIGSFEEFKKEQTALIARDLKDPAAKIHVILSGEIDACPEILQGEFDREKLAKLEKLIRRAPTQKQIDFENMYGVYTLFRSNANKDDPADVQHLKDLYDACILEFDENMLGPLVDKLRKLGVYDQTMIIITGDHGEEFFEHGGYKHGAAVYDESTHVPLIIKLPRGVDRRRNRIKELVQGIDIMPTVADVLSLPVPPPAQGFSLRGMWEGKEYGPRHEYVYAISSYGLESIRSGEYKLIYHLLDKRHEFYDLRNDSREDRNIYGQGIGEADKLEKDLGRWGKSLASHREERDFSPEIDKATIERIRKTGYW